MAAERITIEIRTKGAAFEESPTGEIARILRRLADDFEQFGLPVEKLFDANGNACGTVHINDSED